MRGALRRWQQQVHALKTWTVALYLVCRDPRTPWAARLVAIGVVAYLLSPIDLIPDFIPILGYLDDLVLVPLAIALALRLMPKHLIEEHRMHAAQLAEARSLGRWAAAGIIAIWLAVAALLLSALSRGG